MVNTSFDGVLASARKGDTILNYGPATRYGLRTPGL